MTPPLRSMPARLAPALLLPFLFCACLSRPPAAPPAAPIAETVVVDFTQKGRQAAGVQLAGFSVAEAWGSWVAESTATVKLARPLPSHFRVSLTGGAFKTNIGKPIELKAGSETKTVTFPSDPFAVPPPVVSAEFQAGGGATTLELRVPELIKAGNGDERTIAIGLIRMDVVPLP